MPCNTQFPWATAYLTFSTFVAHIVWETRTRVAVGTVAIVRATSLQCVNAQMLEEIFILFLKPPFINMLLQLFRQCMALK
jgi:hypothetical protein